MGKTNVRISLCFLGLFLGTSLKVEAQTWSFTGNMHVARTYHTATLITSAELDNPSTATFSSTGSLNQGRESATAVLLPTSGEVLVVGGSFLGGLVQLKHAA
jgi:hypothetical protein